MNQFKARLSSNPEQKQGLSEAAAVPAGEEVRPRKAQDLQFARHWLPAEFWRQLEDHRDSSVAAPVRWRFRTLRFPG